MINRLILFCSLRKIRLSWSEMNQFNRMSLKWQDHINGNIWSETWKHQIRNSTFRFLYIFFSFSDPNKDGKNGRRVAEAWHPYNEEDGDFLKVRYPFESAKHMFEERVNFWKETVPALYRRRVHSRKMHAKLFKGWTNQAWKRKTAAVMQRNKVVLHFAR